MARKIKKLRVEVVGVGLGDWGSNEIVKLGGRYYLKDDIRNVVRTYNPKTHREKYFLKSSKLVVNNQDVGYIIKSNAFYCHYSNRYWPIKTWAFAQQFHEVKIGNKTYCNMYTCNVEGVDYLVDDNRVERDIYSGVWVLKEKTVLVLEGGRTLAPRFRKENDIGIIEIAGTGLYSDYANAFEAIFKGTVQVVTMSFIRDHLGISNRDLNNRKLFLEWGRDVGNFNNIKYIYILDRIAPGNPEYKRVNGVYIKSDKYDAVIAAHNKWKRNFLINEVEKHRLYANSNYGDAGPDENNVELTEINGGLKIRNGGEIGWDYRPNIILSKTSNLLGGINYTNGVEVETSYGFLTEDEVRDIMWATVGDNSIQGQEYITAPFHGDKGVEYLKRGCDMIAKRCLVDDTCSIHVHVGGFHHEKINSPTFNRLFSQRAIMLGTQIEADLYLTQPKARSPYKKHCASITHYNGEFATDFRDMDTSERGLDRLSEYIYGQPDYFRKGARRPPNRGRWIKERYRWLNLINCNTATHVKTLEIRTFAGSTNFHKILQAVRISNAFVWFVENRPRQIERGGITLISMVKEAYRNHPTVLKDVLHYIDTRTKKFNRKLY